MINLFLETHVYFQMSVDEHIGPACNLQSTCRSPYEDFYGIILTPKQTIQVIFILSFAQH